MTKHPNIVFLITDQQRYDTISALGFPHVDTPNLDRLVAEGVHLTGCYAAAPSCVPARASLFSGYYPHTTGVLNNASSWQKGWIEDLAAAGYDCVNLGKMHTQPMDAPAGFRARKIVENKDRSMAKRGRNFVDEWDKAILKEGYEKPGLPTYSQLNDYADRLGAFEWPLPRELHSDVFVGDMAVDWISNARLEAPYFLQVGFPGPHPPYDPMEEEVAPYLDRDLKIRPVADGDLHSQPGAFQRLAAKHAAGDHDAVRHKIDAPEQERHRQRAYYLANVTMIDAQIGKIIDALENAGQLDNTIIVFTSDHGDSLGDHGHSQKWTMYEEVIRLPLVIWGPGHFEATGAVDGLVQHMDVAPTLFDLAGLEFPEGREAVSFATALRGEPFEGREAVYCEQGLDVVFQFSSFVSMVRTDRWKYVHLLDDDFGQLFDLLNDPDEEINLWNDPAMAGIRRDMHDRLTNWRMSSAYQTRDWAEAAR
jgi:arylsulfatase A-like enzyme